MTRWLIFVTLALGASRAPEAARPINAKDGCRTNPAIVAPCFEFWGRAFASNGTPSLRIGVDGTKTILGVLPAEREIAPACLRSGVTFDQEVSGRFTVCPFSQEKRGSMRMVCVEDVASAEARPKEKASRGVSARPIWDCRPVLSERTPPPAEYVLLASHHDLYGPRVGIEHADGSAEARSFRALLEHPQAQRWFQSLTTEVKVGARLYGLCGLRFVLPDRYDRAVSQYTNSDERISLEDADQTWGLRIRDLFTKRNPLGSFPRFCDQLAGRSP